MLDGILCHNGELLQADYRPAAAKDWAAFEAEYRACLVESAASGNLFPMTLEGCVMRISDVIAYIGRDFEDAIRVHLIEREGAARSGAGGLGTPIPASSTPWSLI